MAWICPMCSSANSDTVSVCNVCACDVARTTSSEQLQKAIFDVQAHVIAPTMSVINQQQATALYREALSEKKKKNFTRAARLLLQGAELGSPCCQCELGVSYRYGQGFKTNLAYAFFWFRTAAKQADARAQYNTGVCYVYGLGVAKEDAKGYAWLYLAAQNGFAAAMCELGECYRHGRGVEKDAVQAVAWYRNAAAAGDARARHLLGECYLFGRGVDADFAKATAYMNKAKSMGYIPKGDSPKIV